MQDQKTEIRIWKSYDYEKFKFFKSNRPIKANRGLIESISKRDLTPYKPVLVTNNFEIIDGQHRFYACKAAKKPIYYIFVENGRESDIINLNKDQSKFSPKHFLHHFTVKGNENYVRVTKLINSWPELTLAMVFRVLGMGGNGMKRFKEGRMILTSQHIIEIKDLMEVYLIILNQIDKRLIGRKMALWDALRTIYSAGLDIKTLKRQITRFPHVWKAASLHEEFLQQIENIYNYHKRDKIIIAPDRQADANGYRKYVIL